MSECFLYCFITDSVMSKAKRAYGFLCRPQPKNCNLREIGISADNPQDFFLYDYRSPQGRPIKLPCDGAVRKHG